MSDTATDSGARGELPVATHRRFESAIRALGGERTRTVETTPRCIEQVVVTTNSGAVLRWPVSYSNNARPGVKRKCAF